MLLIHLMQQWFGYSYPAMEEALHDIPMLRELAGLHKHSNIANNRLQRTALLLRR
jgi:IS5 family transposase